MELAAKPVLQKQRFGIFIVIRIYIFDFSKTAIIRTYSEDIVTKEIFYSARFLPTAESIPNQIRLLDSPLPHNS